MGFFRSVGEGAGFIYAIACHSGPCPWDCPCISGFRQEHPSADSSSDSLSFRTEYDSGPADVPCSRNVMLVTKKRLQRGSDEEIRGIGDKEQGLRRSG